MPANRRDLLAVPVAALAVVGCMLLLTQGGSSSDAARRLLPLGLSLLVGAAWVLLRQRPGSALRAMALTIATATAMPLLAEPARQIGRAQGYGVAWMLGSAASLLLAAGIVGAIPLPTRRLVGLVAASCGAAVGGLGLVSLGGLFPPGIVVVAVPGLLVATTMVPAVTAAVVRYTTPSGHGERARIVPAAELAVAGLTPAIGWLTVFGSGERLSALVPLGLWIAVVLAAGMFAVRPLVRVATRATVERDVVLAAMEAERSRLAADLHDDALQDLTMLVRRLDATGDAEGAELTRHVADRLRAICGDLRLPILDDLGTGPALEWLVDRVGRLSGGDVRLERRDTVRPPADVELAFFRVAQEALANAVKHGRPPVVVRYATDPSGASLAVDDAGAGIDPDVAAQAVSRGRFGLLNMEQRAQQVGAILDVRRWPRGGTHVALEWRAA